MEALLQEWLTQWQRLTQESLQRIAEASAEAAGAQFFAGQEQWLRLLTLANEAWMSWQAAGGSPQQWSTVLAGFSERLRQQLVGSIAAWQDAQHLQETWQLYIWSWQQLSQPWLSFFGQKPGVPPGEGSGSPGEAAGAAFGQGWEGMFGAPGLGPLRELTNRQKQVFTLWQTFQQTGADYQLLIGNCWIAAFQDWMERLAVAAQAGQPFSSHRQLIDQWVEVADARFLTLFQSEAYLQVQGRLLNTSLELRRQQRLLTESWLRLNDLPTQSDLDEAHRQIYALRKEVRALNKRLDSLLRSPKAAGEAVPRRRRATKS